MIAVLLVALTIASCGGDAPEPSDDAVTSGETAEPIFMVFVERTDDTAAWNARYQSKVGARTDHGMSEVLSAADLDSTGTVIVVQDVEDPERATDYLTSEEAVLGASTTHNVTSYRMIEIGSMPERPVALVVIRNRVDDFDAWRAEFERTATVRGEAGIHVAGIGRGLKDDADMFQAYFATDLEVARRWAEGEEAESIRFVDPIN